MFVLLHVVFSVVTAFGTFLIFGAFACFAAANLHSKSIGRQTGRNGQNTGCKSCNCEKTDGAAGDHIIYFYFLISFGFYLLSNGVDIGSACM